MNLIRTGLAFLLLGVAAPLVAREWTDSTGKSKTNGEFVKLEDGKVHLKKDNGSIAVVPLDRLSKADIAYVRSITASADGSATKGFPMLAVQPDKVGTVREFGDLGWPIKSLAFSPGGRFVAAGKADRAVIVFDIVRGVRAAFQEKLEHLGAVTPVAFTPDGKHLITAGYTGVIEVWTVDSKGGLKSAGKFAGHTTEIISMCVSRDGKYVLSGDREKNVRYWDIATCTQAFANSGFEYRIYATHITRNRGQGLAFDGRHLSLLDLKSGETIERMQLRKSAHGTAFSPNGELFAVCSGYDAQIYEIKSGQPKPELKIGQIAWSLAFSPNDRYVVTGERGQVGLWEVSTATRREVFPMKGSYYVQTLAFSPDGRHIAAIPGSSGQTLEIIRIPAKYAEQ